MILNGKHDKIIMLSPAKVTIHVRKESMVPIEHQESVVSFQFGAVAAALNIKCNTYHYDYC